MSADDRSRGSTPLIDFSQPAAQGVSITPDEISVGELKAGARLIMHDLRDTHRAVLITEESGRTIGVLMSPTEFGRLRDARARTGLGLGGLRDRLADRFSGRVRVHSDPARRRQPEEAPARRSA